jgi:hypothetical protein
LLEEGGDGEELQEAQAAVEGDEVEALGCDPGLEVCEDGLVVGGDVGVDAVAEGVLPGGGGWRCASSGAGSSWASAGVAARRRAARSGSERCAVVVDMPPGVRVWRRGAPGVRRL